MSNVSHPVAKVIGNEANSEEQDRSHASSSKLDIARWTSRAALAGAAVGSAALAAALLYVSRRKEPSKKSATITPSKEAPETD
jgi:hypothetical protein